jgi:hypothetical protein
MSRTYLRSAATAAVFLLVCEVSASAQRPGGSVTGAAGSQVANESPSTQVHPVDCSHMYSSGCKSLNEMIAAGDKDVVRSIGSGAAIGCFSTGEDRFFIISFDLPTGLFSPKPHSPKQLMYQGMILLSLFKEGTSEDYQYAMGAWNKFDWQRDEEATFRSDPNSDLAVRIDSSEIVMSYKFENLMHTKTSHIFKVRRSTLRFTEMFEAPLSKPDKPTSKGNHPAAQKSPEISQTSAAGYCAKVE